MICLCVATWGVGGGEGGGASTACSQVVGECAWLAGWLAEIEAFFLLCERKRGQVVGVEGRGGKGRSDAAGVELQ